MKIYFEIRKPWTISSNLESLIGSIQIMKTNLIFILGFSTAVVCWENNSNNEAAPLGS
jgi:hypothetical protein